MFVFVGVGDDDISLDQFGIFYFGVVCDGCDKFIFGIRFKCVVCSNFDFCLICEIKGIYKEYEMFRIIILRVFGYFWVYGFNFFAFYLLLY